MTNNRSQKTPSRRSKQLRRSRNARNTKLGIESLEARRLLTTLLVNSVSDGPVDLSDNVVTLRDAISAANNDVAVSPGGAVGSGADTIEFDVSLANAVIRLTEGELEITDEVTLDGAAIGITVTADANGDDVLVPGTTITDVGATMASDPTLLGDNTRVFNIMDVGAATTFHHLTITGGKTGGTGGGIRSLAPLTLMGSTVSGNSTTGLNGDGGGIHADRIVTLTNSTVSGNSTSGNSANGGGIFARRDVNLTSSTLSGNFTTGSFAEGGGMYVLQDINLTNSIVTGNVTVNAGFDQIRSGGTQSWQGGTIQGGRLRDGDTTVQTGLTATDIFANTTEVIDGTGAPTGVFAGALAKHAGVAAMIALSPTGAAVDTGDADLATGIDFDQRGASYTRVFGTSIDIGAYEFQPLIVDTLTDESDGDFSAGDFSLREALGLANLLSGTDTVTFDTSLAGGVIRLTEGQLEITDEVFLDGASLGITVSGDASGNDLLVAGTTITDVGATMADDPTRMNDNTRVFEVVGAGSATTVVGLSITGGRTTNAVGNGGGIRSDAAVTFANSTVSGNSTTGSSAEGGGVYSIGTVSFINSTVSGNSTTGGIADGGGIVSLGGVSLNSSTVSGNSTTGGFARGGGIRSSGGITLTNSMVTGNVAVSAGSNQILILGGSVIRQGGTIQGTTLRDDAATVQTGLTAADIFATTTEVIDGAGAGTGVFTGVLADNRGASATMALLARGAAVDTGDQTIGTQPSFDQRGAPFVREFGPDLDIGAYEVQPLVVDTLADESDGDFSAGDLSLRESLELANAIPGADTIAFDAAVFTGGANSLIRLQLGQLTISEAVHIDGGSLEVVISGDSNGDDTFVPGTFITDIVASDTAGVLGDNSSRIFNVAGSAAGEEVKLTGLTVTGGDQGGSGGGINGNTSDLVIEQSSISGNRATGNGGGIRSVNSGTVTLTNSTVSGNSSGDDGGGIRTGDGAVTLTSSTVSGNSITGNFGRGGGIRTSSGAVTLTSSTVSGNSSGADGGGIFAFSCAVMLTSSTVSGNSSDVFGGGIYAGSSDVTLTSSTVSGNSSGFDGGGIFTLSGDVTLTNSTVSGNSSGDDGGGIFVYNTLVNPLLTIQNSIVAGNMSGGTAPDLQPDPDGTLDIDFSLIGDNDGTGLTEAQTADANGNLIGSAAGAGIIDPLLGPLADNGGPTMTHALVAGSPAIDAGDPAIASPPNNDQRGAPFVRQYGTIDIGAYEMQPLVVDTLDDESDGDYSALDLSLREALELANAIPGADTITFDAAVFTGGANSLIRLQLGQLRISEAVHIDGGSLEVVISGDSNGDDTLVPGTFITDIAASDTAGVLGDNSSRIFNVTGSAAGEEVRLTGLTVTGGDQGGSGGGINGNTSDLVIEQSSISGNRAGGVGGGIRSVNSGTVTLTNSIVSGNSSDDDGGGIRTDDGAVTLTSSTVSGNSSTGNFGRGGGIRTRSGAVTLTSSTVSGNSTGDDGGGIRTSYGAVTLTSSTVSGNSSGDDGGGILTAYGAVTLTSSTVSGNSSGDDGGGIFTLSGDVTLTNSTVSGNSSDGDGGGIRASDGAVTLTSSTVSGNSSGNRGGGIFVYNTGGNPLLTIQNSIVADNMSSNTAPDLRPDPDGTLDIDFSLIGDNEGTGLTEAQTADANGNLISSAAGAGIIDPLLGPLADNGGPTLTHALTPGSPGINAGDPTAIAGQNGVAAFDQRGTGFGRVDGGRIDIGAFETLIAPVTVSFTRQNPAAATTNADTLQFRAEFSEQVQNVDINDFVVSGDSTASTASVVPIQGTGEAVYLITIGGGDLASFNGTVGLDLAASQDITDTALNALIDTEPTVDETYLLDNIAPQVTSFVIDDGTAQRSMVRSITVNFDSPIVFNSGAFDLQTTAGAAISVMTSVTPGTETSQVVLTFPGTIGGSLSDGNYRLQIVESLIRDATGNGLDGNADGTVGGVRAADEFFRLFGDANGDRTVNPFDAFQLRRAMATYNDEFDFNNDGTINPFDTFQFRQRMGTTL